MKAIVLNNGYKGYLIKFLNGEACEVLLTEKYIDGHRRYEKIEPIKKVINQRFIMDN